MKKLFYRPILTDAEVELYEFETGDCYCKFENAVDAFPSHRIEAFESELETLNVLDIEFSEHFYVDIPNIEGDEWLNVEMFNSKEEAINFAIDRFGADHEGKVCLISQS